MAMRAVLKKIPPPNIRFLKGRQLYHSCFGRGCETSRLEDRTYFSGANWGKQIQEQQQQLSRKEEIIKEIFENFDNQLTCLQKLSSHEFREEEQQRYLKGFEWTYLNYYLYLSGLKSRQLLCMKSDHTIRVHGKVGAAGNLEFSIPSLSLGLLSSKQLALPRGALYGFPRQTVSGLVCVTTWDKDAFVIYNPSTGETSPWIQTTVASEWRDEESSRREVECLAFGFDRKRNEHKVICVSTTYHKEYCREVAEKDDVELVVEVLTINRNSNLVWRRLSDDVIPPAISKYGPRFWSVNPLVYVNGSIYWMYRPEGKTGLLAEFNVHSEEFTCASISSFADRKGAPPPTLQLMEFDGCVGILKRRWDYEATVYTLTTAGMVLDEYDGAPDWMEDQIDWDEENISLPCAWTAGTHLSIESITGTNIFLIQHESSDSVFCYDRHTEASKRFRILHDCERLMQL